MQNFKEKKTFFSFFQKSFRNSHQISKKQKHINAFSEEKGNIEESIFLNYPFDKGRLKTIVCWFFEKHGQYKTLKLLEKLKEVGFGSATNAGISLGIDDLKIPNQKIALLSTAETKVAKDLLHYRNAKITGIERVQRLIYTWNQTNDTLKQEVVRLFETTDLLNPIYMMAFSGARGNMSQVRQLVGMRGLMSDPQGQIIDFPIQSNFREGLTLTEYLISTYGARKGIVDTALRTATAGYLTRRLVDVAQHTIVSKFDCGTMRGIFLFDMKDGKKTIYSFQNRLIGRVLAQNIEFSDSQSSGYGNGDAHTPTSLLEKNNEKGMVKKKQIAFRNIEIDSKLAQAISKVTKKAFVRSPLTCETSRFVCQLCYGWSFSHGKLVSVGEAVGIIAAQSIGEPGTQLTMRTFHTGGVFAGGLTDQILAPFDGKIQYFQSIPGSCIRNALSEIAFFTKMPGSFLVEKLSKSFDSMHEKKEESFSHFEKQAFENRKNRKKRAEILRIPAYAVLFCRNNEFVRKKQVLAQFSTVFKKMQYGRAEQTLYSTLAGEFVFGSAQRASFFTQNAVLHDSKISKNFHTSGEQSLLVEKRKGDFSEVELKNDILWKSQNWTTVWILSGNIFSDSFTTNFHYRKGDFFKKTSVLQRILWTKKKRYKYSFFGKNQSQKKIENTFSYLFAFEKKKFANSFFSFSPSQKRKEKNPFLQNHLGGFQKSFQIFSEKSKTFLQPSSISVKNISPSPSQSGQRRPGGPKYIQTNFSISKISFSQKESFLKSKKIFPFCLSVFSQRQYNFYPSLNKLDKLVPTPNEKVYSNISFNIEKNIDFHFVQNKSNRFLTDFQKMNLREPSFFQKYNRIKDENMKNHLFFKFLNKRKKSGYPLFLNGSTFYKSFQISQKFGFFSSFSNFSNLSFFNSFSHYQFHNLKNKISFDFQNLRVQYQGTSFKNQPFLISWKKKKENKLKVFKTSFFSNTPSAKKKNISKNSNFLEKETKNILLRKYLLRFPVDKMYYKKFGYVSCFSNSREKKKIKNSFQSFSTLTTKENFENLQRNRGQKEKVFPPSSGISSAVGTRQESTSSNVQADENFFGKDVPHYLSFCFFEKFSTTMGGIFQFSSFAHDFKKQKIYHFLCENFSDHEEKKILFLKPEFLEKTSDFEVNKPFSSLSRGQNPNGPKNIFLYSHTLFHFSDFLNKKENLKKPKKSVFFQNEPLFIFQIPTFSFLSLSTNSFLKPFYLKVTFPKKEKKFTLFEKQQELFQLFEKRKNQKNDNKKNSFPSSTPLQLQNFPPSEEKPNFNFQIPLPEFGNGNKSSGNGDKAFFVIGTEKISGKKLFDETSKSFKKETFSPLVLPVMPSFFEKRKQIEISANNLKTKFFDFSNSPFFSLNEKKNGNSTKKLFFFYNFCFQKVDEFPSSFKFSEKRKQKNFSFDLYEKEISWLPQENFLVYTSEILPVAKQCFVENNFYTFSFYSRSDHKPFLFFVNSQGKKKSFFNSHSEISRANKKSMKETKFEGFVQISNFQIFGTPDLPVQNKNKERKILSQKLSFYPVFKKNQKNIEFAQNNRKKLYKKTILFLFQKRRKKNQNFENIQKLFSSKHDSLKTAKKMHNKSFVFNQKKTTNLKNQSFFAKKFKNQCFTCLPFLRSSDQNLKNNMSSSPFRKNKSGQKLEKKQKSKIVFQNKKLQFKVQQGWLVFPFSFAVNNALLKDHKKIQKKGHIFEKNINFEQNDTFLETVLLEKSFNLTGFVSKKYTFQKNTDGGVQTKKISFQADFVQRNKKCRYISFNQSFEFEMKKQLQRSHLSQKKERKQKSVLQFFRPFQYKVLENSQNSKKFFQNIRIQAFSKILASSCFQLYKSYHSSLLNTQKPEKLFLEKNPNTDFQVWSNFEEMYFSQSVSSFISFAQNTEKVSFQKQFLKKLKSQEIIHEKLKNSPNFSIFFKKASQSSAFDYAKLSHMSNGEAPGFGKFLINEAAQQIPERNGTKNFFFHFGKNQENKKNFSFYPVQFLPLGISFFSNESKNDSLSNQKSLSSGMGTNSSFPLFSLNVFQNTVEFILCEKRAAFFHQRFSLGNISDFIETSSFWLNKDSMNFLFSPFLEFKKSKKVSLHFKNTLVEKQKKKISFRRGLQQNFLFQKNIQFYGSTEFQSPYEGELLPIFTHDMYWWKKASEVSTLQKFEKLFTIVSRKDLFSVQFPLEKELSKRKMKLSLKEKQKHLGKLYEALSDFYQKKNLTGNYENFVEISSSAHANFEKKTKISSFITKYEKKIYTFQNLTVGYPSLFKKPFLGNFVAYGDNFFGSAIQKPGQIIHLGFSSMTVRRGQPCFVSSNGILHFSNIPYIKKNVPLVTLPYQTVQAGDIVQGIPKVEQFFEARTTLQGRLFVSSLPILLKGIFERYKVLLPLEQATRQSFLKIQQIIVDGVQRVYRSQGVSITDKHLEVVVRQMTTKVQILHGAQTGFFPGELVNLDLVERINTFLMVKIRYEPVILGITRASLEVDSFLSASSFQQTTKILSLAAISRKKDFLKGLKENLLVGNLIPSGTGYFNLSKKI